MARRAKSADLDLITPAAVAERMIFHVRENLKRATRLRPIEVLEPSAGRGAIIARLTENLLPHFTPWMTIMAVEGDKAKLDDEKGVRSMLIGGTPNMVKHFVHADFLKWESPHPYDVVLMNPPFVTENDKQAYVDHVLTAYSYLAPGGRLVAVTPVGWQGETRLKKLKNFQRLVAKYGFAEALPDNAFQTAGTPVSTCLVVLDRSTDNLVGEQ